MTAPLASRMRSRCSPSRRSPTTRYLSNGSTADTNTSARCGTTSCHCARSPDRRVSGLDDAEILGLPVRANHPAAGDVIGVVLEVALASDEHLERRRRATPAGMHRVSLDTVLLDANAEERVVLRARDAHVEALVELLVHEDVRGRIGPDDMTLDALGEQRLRVDLDVEDRLVVGGPGDVARRAGQLLRIELAGRDVLELDDVLAAADGVGRSTPAGRCRARRPTGPARNSCARPQARSGRPGPARRRRMPGAGR